MLDGVVKRLRTIGGRPRQPQASARREQARWRTGTTHACGHMRGRVASARAFRREGAWPRRGCWVCVRVGRARHGAVLRRIQVRPLRAVRVRSPVRLRANGAACKISHSRVGHAALPALGTRAVAPAGGESARLWLVHGVRARNADTLSAALLDVGHQQARIYAAIHTRAPAASVRTPARGCAPSTHAPTHAPTRAPTHVPTHAHTHAHTRALISTPACAPRLSPHHASTRGARSLPPPRPARKRSCKPKKVRRSQGGLHPLPALAMMTLQRRRSGRFGERPPRRALAQCQHPNPVLNARAPIRSEKKQQGRDVAWPSLDAVAFQLRGRRRTPHSQPTSCWTRQTTPAAAKPAATRPAAARPESRPYEITPDAISCALCLRTDHNEPYHTTTPRSHAGAPRRHQLARPALTNILHLYSQT